VLSFVAASLALFFSANSKPTYWLQNEMIAHDYFWSLDGIGGTQLRSGLRWSDFSKILASDKVEGAGAFRARPISYLVEMLSFKFEQRFLQPSLRSRTLILIHLINVVLLGMLAYRVTRNAWAAICGALLLLGCSIALTTVSFTFRNA